MLSWWVFTSTLSRLSLYFYSYIFFPPLILRLTKEDMSCLIGRSMIVRLFYVVVVVVVVSFKSTYIVDLVATSFGCVPCCHNAGHWLPTLLPSCHFPPLVVIVSRWSNSVCGVHWRLSCSFSERNTWTLTIVTSAGIWKRCAGDLNCRKASHWQTIDPNPGQLTRCVYHTHTYTRAHARMHPKTLETYTLR